MKTHLSTFKLLILLVAGVFCKPIITFSQTAEWRLVLKEYNTADPDGVGPAIASVKFDLEMRAVTGTIVTREISVGYTYQSVKAMVPTTPNGPGCPATVNNPANITVSPEFIAGGYSYGTVNQCNTVPTIAGSQVLDRVAAGSLDLNGDGVTLTTAWVPALTITLWAISPLEPQGGYAALHSSGGGSPGPLGSYSMADDGGNEVTVNSKSYSDPIELSPSAVLPVGLSKFDITCTGNGAKLNWQTLTEQNSKNFEIQKSSNGATGWAPIGTMAAAGNSTLTKQYEYYDLKGGSAYYRLRQVDRDGQYTYSAVQNVNCKSRSNNILLYPVPAKNILNLVLSTERETKATILLVDISGKIMRQVKTDLQKGTNNLKVNVAGLSSGEYILKVVGAEAFNTQKVTIIN